MDPANIDIGHFERAELMTTVNLLDLRGRERAGSFFSSFILHGRDPIKAYRRRGLRRPGSVSISICLLLSAILTFRILEWKRLNQPVARIFKVS